MSSFFLFADIFVRWIRDHFNPPDDAVALSVSKHMNIQIRKDPDIDRYYIRQQSPLLSSTPPPNNNDSDNVGDNALEGGRFDQLSSTHRKRISLDLSKLVGDDDFDAEPPIDYDSVDMRYLDQHNIRIISMNCWGLPIAPFCQARVRKIERLFPHFDVIVLQECTHPREVGEIIDAAHNKHSLHYHHWFRQGIGFPIWHDITAPGLLVLSRFPIRHVEFKRFSINGQIHQIHHSDFMGSKGVGLIRIDLSSHPQCALPHSTAPRTLDLFVTHLHANYTNFSYDSYRHIESIKNSDDKANDSSESEWNFDDLYPDEYIAHRVAQAYELSRFICSHRIPSHLTVLAGDINAPAYDLISHIVRALTQLIDAFGVLHPSLPGYTCLAPDNTFSPLYDTFIAEKASIDKQMFEQNKKQNEESNKTDDQNGHQASSSPAAPSSYALQFASSLSSSVPSLSSIGHHLMHPSAAITNAVRRFLLEKKSGALPKRIDYILFSPPLADPLPKPFPLCALDAAALPPSPSIRLVECKVVKPFMYFDDDKYSISDHWGIAANFQLMPSSTSSPLPVSDVSGEIHLWKDNQKTIIEAEHDIDTNTSPFTPRIVTCSSFSSFQSTIDNHINERLNEEKIKETEVSKDKSTKEKKKKKKATFDPFLISGKMTALSPSHSSQSLHTMADHSSDSNLSKNKRIPSHAPQSVPPPLLSILALAREILFDGVKDIRRRRRRHLIRMAVTLIIFLICRYFSVFEMNISPLALPAIRSLDFCFHLIYSFFIAIYALLTKFSTDPLAAFFSSLLSSHHFADMILSPPSYSASTPIISYLFFFFHVIEYLLPGYIWTEFLIATFFGREEQTAIRQSLAEVVCDIHAIKREIRKRKINEKITIDT